MKLTKKEIIERLIKGEKLYSLDHIHIMNHYCYYDEYKEVPFRLLDLDTGTETPMVDMWNMSHWEVYGKRYWEPKSDEMAFYIDSLGCINISNRWSENVDKQIIYQGNVFKTEEEALKESDLRRAKYRVKKRIWELNGGKTLEFQLDGTNWSFDLCEGVLETYTWSQNKLYPNWQYIISKEIGNILIDEMYDDLMLIRSE